MCCGSEERHPYQVLEWSVYGCSTHLPIQNPDYRPAPNYLLVVFGEMNVTHLIHITNGVHKFQNCFEYFSLK